MTHFCLSVDVEEDLPGILPHGVRGIEDGLPALCEILDEVRVRADFFFLASVVREYPDLVRDAVNAGHGIGNHGLDHSQLCQKPIDRQREDVRLSTRIVTDAGGVPPRMFRAPNFSADSATLALLEEEGYVVDSSVLPGRVLRRGFRTVYDHRGAPTRPYYPGRKQTMPGRLLEIPVTPNPRRPGTPFGQGALNTYGPASFLEMAKTLDSDVLVFLVHPWELVDLASYYPGLPSGYSDVCTSDCGPLRSFLMDVSKNFSTTTLNNLARAEGGDVS